MQTLQIWVILDTRATEIIQKDEVGNIVRSNWFTPGGVELSEAVVEHLKSTYQFYIGRLSAELIIFSVGSVDPFDQNRTTEAVGRNLITGKPDKQIISTGMIQEPLDRLLNVMVSHVVRQIRFLISNPMCKYL